VTTKERRDERSPETVSQRSEQSPASSDGAFALGGHIKEVRKARAMTMAELANRTGLSAGGLSQIESGTIHPSLTTLRRIAAALDEPIFRFFLDHATEPQVVVRANARRKVAIANSAASYELLTPNLRGDLEVMEMRIEPGGISADAPLAHRGEECIVLLQGRARIEIGEGVYELEPGDSATFRAELPHRTSNIGDDTLVAISVITPPAF
jgi:transcriptional regulator with XRE-family HTH domain